MCLVSEAYFVVTEKHLKNCTISRISLLYGIAAVYTEMMTIGVRKTMYDIILL